MKVVTKTREAISLRPILLGVALAWAIMLMASLILAMMLHFTGFSERTLPVSTAIVAAVAVFSAGAHAGRRSGRMGWLHGGIAGLVLGLLAWVLAGPVTGVHGTFLGLLRQLAVAFGLGIAGGVFGVNL